MLDQGDFDGAVVATGIIPRSPKIDGIDHPKVLTYIDVMKGADMGKVVAVIGAGGIGFDICEVLIHQGLSTSQDISGFMAEWGIDMSLMARGGVEGVTPKVAPSPRQVYLLQRRAEKVGGTLGKTTGWIHRMELTRKGVKMVAGCDYQRIDDKGLHLLIAGKPTLLAVDNVIICAGQKSNRKLVDEITRLSVHIIGGAHNASQLDAKGAIDQGTRLAAQF